MEFIVKKVNREGSLFFLAFMFSESENILDVF